MGVATPPLPARYTQLELAGSGGSGEIYVAHDERLRRRVAIKVLARDYAERPELKERFTREAHAAARVSGHPNIVAIHDVGECEGRPFIVMEHLVGGSLADALSSGPVARDRVLAWLEGAAVALDAAHAQGVLHRDVKPANLLLDDRGQIRVVDFGIARVLDDAAGSATATGTVLGTAGYLAPEQAMGLETSAATDVYALGVVAYELLTGARPFRRDSATAEAAAHIYEPVPPASTRDPSLAPAVDRVLARALAKEPEARYAGAEEFVRELRAAVEGRAEAAPAPPPAPRAPEPETGERREGWLDAIPLPPELRLPRGSGGSASGIARLVLVKVGKLVLAHVLWTLLRVALVVALVVVLLVLAVRAL